jgi:PKD repeat protein/succinylglutamate desuccinylase
MKKFLFMMIFLAFAAISPAQPGWRPGEMQLKVFLSGKDDAIRLHQLRLDDELASPDGHEVYVYATLAELQKIISAGLTYAIEIPDLAKYTSDLKQSGALLGFFNYSTIVALADSLAENFPTICRKYLLGTTPEGRQLGILKISDNVDLNEDEPEVMFEGGIHGDELMGPEIVIRYARDLCKGYGIDSVYTELVGTREIWLYYLVNPDGYVNMSRYNSNGVDCNRDFGYMWGGEGSSSGYFSQPESKIIRNLQLEHNFALFTDYHAGTEIISYPWSYRTEVSPDNAALTSMAAAYSNASGYPSLQYGQGYNVMYQIFGSTKDNHYGPLGQISWSIEVSTLKQPPANQIEMFYSYNAPAMTEVIKRAEWGIQGKVTDSLTGEPVRATIFVNNLFPVYSDPRVGDYHKVVQQGAVTVKVLANGYVTKTISNVIIPNQSTATLDVRLERATGRYAYRVIACEIPDFPNLGSYLDESNTPGAIGAPDSITYSLGKAGVIILDMGDTLVNGPGVDVRVWESGGTPEGYACFASISMDGPWKNLGQGTGTTLFDLATGLLEKARYIKIIDDGDGSANAPDAGFDLDAVEFYTQPLIASFTAESSSPCIGSGVAFTDLSWGFPTSWNWQFPGGDPSSSTVQNPQGIIYQSPGPHDVTLTVTNLNGASAHTRINYIAPMPSPVVDLGSDSLVCLPDSALLDAANPGCSYLWSNGDTTQASWVSQNIPGLQEVWVTVTAPDGCAASDTIVLSFVICDAIGENYTNNVITISPNPSTGVFKLTVRDYSSAVFRVLDLTGRMITDGLIDNVSGTQVIDLAPYPAGIYILLIESEGNSKAFKLVRD